VERELIAVHALHADVGDHQGRALVAHDPQGFDTFGRLEQPMAEVAQQRQNELTVGRTIVDDKDRGHGPLLRDSMKNNRAGGAGKDEPIEALRSQNSSSPIREAVLEAGRAAQVA